MNASYQASLVNRHIPKAFYWYVERSMPKHLNVHSRAGTVRELFDRTQLNDLNDRRSPCPIVEKYGIELN